MSDKTVSICEHIPWYDVENILLKYANSEAECVKMKEEIDRGVEDFKEFALLLKRFFPKIQQLQFKQNFSYNETMGDRWESWEQNLIQFIQTLCLTKLKIFDCQSDWLPEINWLNVINKCRRFNLRND